MARQPCAQELPPSGAPPQAPGLASWPHILSRKAAPVIWLPDRSKHQRRVVAYLYAQAAAVPCGRRAVFAGGLRGAPKDTALQAAGITRGAYFTISIDLILGELARRSLIPVIGGLAPLEGAGLVHAEARHIAARLAARAAADGRDLLLDVTMGSPASAESWLAALGLAAYTVDVVIAGITAEDAVRFADAEHRRGHDAYRAGHGDGGRYVPPGAIRAAAPFPAALAASDWGAVFRQLATRQEPAFPRGDLLTLARACHDGQITLDDFGRRLRDYPLQPVPPTCPPGLEAAGAALDDLEPWTAGSFDEITLACDLGLLTDNDYAALVSAVTT
jgi:hypothetical protein